MRRHRARSQRLSPVRRERSCLSRLEIAGPHLQARKVSFGFRKRPALARVNLSGGGCFPKRNDRQDLPLCSLNDIEALPRA